MDTSKITNVLIFKEGFYYLTVKREIETEALPCNCNLELGTHYHLRADMNDCYQIIPDEWGLYNGFEFASDAYSYLAKLSEEKVAK